MGERILDLVNLIERELKIIRNKDERIDNIISQLENLRDIINDLGDQNTFPKEMPRPIAGDWNPQERAGKIILSINDILYSEVPKINLGKVIEVNLSGENRYEVSPISENEIITILKFFEDNELPNLLTLRIDDRPNANEFLKKLFGSTETKKTLYSLSIISVINSFPLEMPRPFGHEWNSRLIEGEELSKDTIECIYNHFNEYPYLIRAEPINGCYRTKMGIQDELVAPLNINMTTDRMGTYLPWFMGDYRDGIRVSKDKKFKCYYRNRWEASVDIPLYIKINVSN